MRIGHFGLFLATAAALTACFGRAAAPEIAPSEDPATEGWRFVDVPGFWELELRDEKEIVRHDGYAWYRCFVRVPKEWKGCALELATGAIHDADEAFFNGRSIGQTGAFPPQTRSEDAKARSYAVAPDLVRFGDWNLIAFRVFDTGALGGITQWRGNASTRELALSCDKGWMNLAGQWHFRTGDDPAWAAWPDPPGSAAARRLVDTFLESATPSGVPIAPIAERRAARSLWRMRTQDDLRWRPVPVREGSPEALLIARGLLREKIAPPGVVEDLIESASAPTTPALRLWYQRPGLDWHEALALGNGRLGAMVFGHVRRERIALNEDTLWSGRPSDGDYPEALKYEADLRAWTTEGAYSRAERQARKMIHPAGWARDLQTLLPLGDLRIDSLGVESVEDYRRELDLERGVARVEYRVGKAHFTREAFASATDGVLVVRIACDEPGRVAFDARLDSPLGAKTESPQADSIAMRGLTGISGGLAGTLSFAAHACVEANGGEARSIEGRIEVRQADSATLLLATATSFVNYRDTTGDADARCRIALARAQARDYEDLLAAHEAEHARLFNRVDLRIEPLDSIRDDAAKAWQIPTDKRLRAAAQDVRRDPALAALYFQFGRYLLMSASRPGSQPATNRGVWNESASTASDSRPYALDGGLQMNYWPAEVANLAECAEPLLGAMAEIVERGATTARVRYDRSGWVAHGATDLWRATWPSGQPPEGLWSCGGAWLCRSLWEHWAFSRDADFLSRAWPILRGAAEFFLDSLARDVQGRLVVSPSFSPGATFTVDGASASLSDRAALDVAIVRDLFENCIEASRQLGVDAEFRARLEGALALLAPLEIDPQGRLREWRGLDDQSRAEHLSQLFALYPSSQITRAFDEKWRSAARRTLEARGDGASVWGRAWRVSAWARLGEGDQALRLLGRIVADNTLPNMCSVGPEFRIDGNLGATAGIAEMLVQSHPGCAGPAASSPASEFEEKQPLIGEIRLLPALPRFWPSGSVRGLRARGGFEVDLRWSAGQLVEAEIRATADGACRVRLPGVAGASGDAALGPVLEFQAWPGRAYRIVPGGSDASPAPALKPWQPVPFI